MSKISDFSDETGTKIVIKQYTPSDSTKLTLFATNADAVNSMKGFVQAKRIFNSPFHTKIQKFKDSIILFAEQTHDSTKPQNEGENFVCGSVELGIKEAYVNGEIQKFGVISELRIRPEYKNKDIESKLIEAIEKQGKERGISIFYHQFNQGNDPVQEALVKSGYKAGNESTLCTKILSEGTKTEPKSKIGAEEVQFHEITKARAKELLRQYYEKKDFFLKDVDEYVENPDYQGTYVVETTNGETYGGVSLFAEPQESQMMLQKFFFPVEYAYSKWAQIPVMSAVSVCTFALYYVLSGKMGVAPRTSFTIALGCNLGFLFAYSKILSSMKAFSGREPRCRYVGMFYKGNEGMKENIFSMLFSNLDNVAYDKGNRRARMLVEKNESLKSAVPGGWQSYMTSTLFYKYGKKQEEGTETKKGFDNFSFIDPRDW